jgi:hypothetical protein
MAIPKNTVLALFTVCGLGMSGCGGGGSADTSSTGGTSGGGGTTSSVAAKYAGTYTMQADGVSCMADSGYSGMAVTQITPLSDTSVRLQHTAHVFLGERCSGVALQTVNIRTDTATYDGAAIASDGRSVDKITLTAGVLQPIDGIDPGIFDDFPSGVHKEILRLEGGNIYIGSEASANDAQGYPVTLSTQALYINKR